MSETKKNILYVNPFCQETSGADESLVLIVKYLNKEIFNPIVALPGRSPYEKKYEEAGAEIIRFRFSRIKRTYNPFYYLYWFLRQIIEVVLFMVAIKQYKIDLVHNNMEVLLAPAIAAMFMRKKCIYHVRHNASDNPKWIYNLFVRVINRLSDKIFVISNAVGEIFFKREVKAKVEVLYNAIEAARYFNENRDDFFKKNFDVDENTKIVCTVGRISKRKNVEEFIEMAERINIEYKKAKFVIVGDAHFRTDRHYYERLKRIVKSKKLKDVVLFAGRQGFISYVMKSSDIITISSHYEGFGRVIVEAMAVGKPVVGCDSGAVPEIMDWCECGIIYPKSNVGAFSEAVLKLLKDTDECRRLGEAGQKRVKEKFTVETQRDRLMASYSNLLRLS